MHQYLIVRCKGGIPYFNIARYVRPITLEHSRMLTLYSYGIKPQYMCQENYVKSVTYSTNTIDYTLKQMQKC